MQRVETGGLLMRAGLVGGQIKQTDRRLDRLQVRKKKLRDDSSASTGGEGTTRTVGALS